MSIFLMLSLLAIVAVVGAGGFFHMWMSLPPKETDVRRRFRELEEQEERWRNK